MGHFQTKNPNFWHTLKSLGIDDVDTFYCLLEFLRAFGIFSSRLVLFVVIWYIL
jgi:hypothetical protein